MRARGGRNQPLSKSGYLPRTKEALAGARKRVAVTGQFKHPEIKRLDCPNDAAHLLGLGNVAAVKAIADQARQSCGAKRSRYRDGARRALDGPKRCGSDCRLKVRSAVPCAGRLTGPPGERIGCAVVGAEVIKPTHNGWRRRRVCRAPFNQPRLSLSSGGVDACRASGRHHDQFSHKFLRWCNATEG
jgi:hypothetical protein